jgi:enoyl-CoA hydratase/carnithine racemase
MRGAGGKAFCAGGDVVSVRKAVLEKEMGRLGERGHEAADFFREEYQLNHLIWVMNEEEEGGRKEGGRREGRKVEKGQNGGSSTPSSPPSLPRPPPLQLSLWDGVIMGGGVGVSIGSAFRIATEKTLFAMPETAIGFFPDVGGSYWLPRVGGRGGGRGESSSASSREGGGEGGREGVSGLGRYIGLTGVRLGGWDLVKAGIATHFVKSEKVEEVVRGVEGLREGGREGRVGRRYRRRSRR